MNALLLKLVEVGGVPLVLIVLGIVAKKYITPWLEAVPWRYERAREIALVADRITDEMLVMFPGSKWDDWLDAAVDKLISACKLEQNPEIARREIISQMAKKVQNVLAGR